MAVPYLRVAKVQRGRIDLTEVKTIVVGMRYGDAAQATAGRYPTERGRRPRQVGRGWVWDGSIQSMIHQNHVFRARPCREGVNPYFISNYANEMGRRFFIEQGNQTTNLASISMSKVSLLPVPLPPTSEALEILRRVSEALAAADDTETVLDAEAADAARLQSIHPQGRLRRAASCSQDPADEPASALLCAAYQRPVCFAATSRPRRLRRA